MVKINMSELSSELTEEELVELEAAAEKPPVYDEDSPEMTQEMLMQFKRMNKEELLDLAINDEDMVRKCI